MKNPKVGEYWYVEYILARDGVQVSKGYEIDKCKILAVCQDFVILSTDFGVKRCSYNRLICKIETHWFWKLFGFK